MSLTQDQLMRATATPAALGKYIGPDFLGMQYKTPPWLLHMERKVLTLLFQPGNAIITISVPPQQGKSWWCGMLLPAWYLGRNPTHTVINVSYNSDHANRSGMRALNLMKRYGQELFGVGVSSQFDAIGDWKLENGFGGMMCAGIRGGITGNPGNLIILDDTLKGAEDANSPTIKKKNLEEWDDSVSTRFHENTKVIIVATRFCEDDLTGEIIARSQAPGYEGFPVTSLNIKALAEPDPDELVSMSEEDLAEWTDFLGRHHGEGLQGMHSQKFFEMKRASTPVGRWMSIHQGTPTATSGGMFPEADWRYWVADGETLTNPQDVRLPEMVKMVRCWDIASSEGSGDWTVGTLMGRSRDNNLFILDRQRFRHAPGGVERLVKATALSDALLWQSRSIRIEKERQGSGITVVDHYKRELLGYDIDGIKAEGDKESRAHTYSTAQNANRVYLPRGASWIKEWTHEHAQMDGKGGRPKHDDQIDTGAYCTNFLVGSGESMIADVGMIQLRDDMTEDQKWEVMAVKRALGV